MITVAVPIYLEGRPNSRRMSACENTLAAV